MTKPPRIAFRAGFAGLLVTLALTQVSEGVVIFSVLITSAVFCLAVAVDAFRRGEIVTSTFVFDYDKNPVYYTLALAVHIVLAALIILGLLAYWILSIAD